MKAMLLISIKIHNIISDLDDIANIGVEMRASKNLEDRFRDWVIYKKKFYQWGMSPLALLAYLIYQY